RIQPYRADADRTTGPLVGDFVATTQRVSLALAEAPPLCPAETDGGRFPLRDVRVRHRPGRPELCHGPRSQAPSRPHLLCGCPVPDPVPPLGSLREHADGMPDWLHTPLMLYLYNSINHTPQSRWDDPGILTAGGRMPAGTPALRRERGGPDSRPGDLAGRG